MEIRTIKINNEWYGINDIIVTKEPIYTLFGRMPWKRNIRWYISFIGNDSSAVLTAIEPRWGKKTIVGSVNIIQK